MKQFIYFCFVFICIQLVSCNKNAKYSDERTPEEDSALYATGENVLSMTPNALKMINQGLHKAKDSLTYYEYYMRLGEYYAIQNDVGAMKYADKVINFAKHQKETPRINELLGIAYSTKAAYYSALRQNMDEAIALDKQAYDLFMKSSHKNNAPDLMANLGDMYVVKNDIINASSCYRKALFLVDSLNLPKEKNVSLYMGLAHIYQMLNDNDLAEKYYSKTEKFFRTLKSNMKIVCLCNTGSFYYYKGDYHKSLRYFKRMSDAVKSNGPNDVFSGYLCKINLADVYLNLGDIKNAIYYLNLSEPYFRKGNMSDFIYFANTIRIGIAIKQNNMDIVEGVLKNEKVATPSDPGITETRNKYLRKMYEKTGRYEDAYHSLKKSIAIEDSLAQRREYMRASEIMMRFAEDTISLHKKIAIQQKDIKVNETQSALWISISVILFLILLIAYWYLTIRKRRVQNEMKVIQLKLQNARNLISPHFIFNVLNNKILRADKQESDEIMMLAKLIRANLDISRNTYISLKEELDYVKYYIDIEKYVLDDDFEFMVNAPSDDILKKIIIPSMFVQILTENAIKHGLKCKKGHKLLVIDVRNNSTGTDVIVKDNGIGFDITRSNNTGTRIGLDIIMRTIAIYNQRNKHDNFSFDIHNITDADGTVLGCENVLHIPANVSTE